MNCLPKSTSIRESVRNYVKKEISPIIEEYAQKAEFLSILLSNWATWVVSAQQFRNNMVVAVWIIFHTD
jgi:hypothetical protein